VTQTENLKKYFKAPRNTVTRERIFFNRLSFDLKIAAAKADFHLHIYEPDVDRDGFDIVTEDEGGNVRWLQTKAVLSSVNTRKWQISGRFLRPLEDIVDRHDFASLEGGRGGGVILIEIDAESTNGSVQYYYTDFNIIFAISEGYLIENKITKRGPKPKSAKDSAAEIIQNIHSNHMDLDCWIPKRLFLKLKTPEDLLGVIGYRSNIYYDSSAIHNAAAEQITIDENGEIEFDASLNSLGPLRYNMRMLCSCLADPPNFRSFDFLKKEVP